jgi:hypothetical protein
MSAVVDQRHSSQQPPMVHELYSLLQGILSMSDPPPSAALLLRFEELLAKVSNAYPSEAEIWDVCAIFSAAINRVTETLEFRFKQVNRQAKNI